MGDGRSKLSQSALAVLNFLVEKIVVMNVQRFAIQILVVAITERHGRSRQDIFNPTVQSCLFLFGRGQGFLNRRHDRLDPGAVSLSVPLR